MAAKTLLSAAGLLNRDTKLLKISTATEHAPAASTDDVSRLPLTGLPMSTSKLQASASKGDFIGAAGFHFGDDDLEKIVALLLWMAQDFQSNIHIDEIHYAALEVVKLGSLQTTSIAKLSKLIDIMMLHKDGKPKDANATLTFMRRLAKIREELRATSSDNATERVEQATSSDNVTERVEQATSSDNATAVSYTHLTLPTSFLL